MEIERKFLIKNLPNLIGVDSIDIEQAYLVIDKEKESRIRRVDNNYFVTIKNGKGIERYEIEYPISKEEYQSFKKQHIGKVINKRRFLIPLSESLTAELDMYSNDLVGLNVVEVEFASLEQANSFKPPSWFSKEITNSKDYKNSSLALKGFPKNINKGEKL